MRTNPFPATALAALWLTASPAPGQTQPDCDRACLIEIAARYVAAMVDQAGSDLPWAERVRFTENDVALMIGDGLWGSITAAGDAPFELADPATGQVLWAGVVEEHGQPAYAAIRLKIEARRIADVEAVVAREGAPIHFAPAAGYAVAATFGEPLRPAERRSREQLIAAAEGYYDTVQRRDGRVLGEIAAECVRISNGVNLTVGEDLPAEGCKALFEIGYGPPADRVRARRYPIVDEERGVVAVLALLDHAAREVEHRTLDGRTFALRVEYPSSQRVMELLKIRDGAVERVEGFAVFQPYLMPSLWE